MFPIGMYAACSFGVGAALPAAGIAEFERNWLWVGVAVWAVVFGAMAGRGPQLIAYMRAARSEAADRGAPARPAPERDAGP